MLALHITYGVTLRHQLRTFAGSVESRRARHHERGRGGRATWRGRVSAWGVRLESPKPRRAMAMGGKPRKAPESSAKAVRQACSHRRFDVAPLHNVHFTIWQSTARPPHVHGR